MKKITEEEKRKFIQDFKGLLSLKDTAVKLGISLPLLSQIINGNRTDTRNVIDFVYNEIEKKIQAIMPQHK